MCDFGADLATALPALVDGALRVLRNVERFKALCADVGLELPATVDQETIQATARALTTDTVDPGPFVESWFAGDDWIQPVVYLTQRKDVRAALPRRAELTAAVGSVVDDMSTAHWLYGLLLVLDDEPFIVLHRATEQGWRCTMSGIGDNFQLHTLLAGRFAEAVGATPPNPLELAAVGTGEPQPEGGIRGTFNLVDAAGEWIWNEGRPSDIPRHDDIRVVVLDPPPYERSWNTGRVYPLMESDLTVDAPLSADEVARWLAVVKPSGG
jgi:hypothetical protein